jgi:hypothetical protein
VKSVDHYVPNEQGDGWRPLGRIATIDYNVDLPDDFFDLKTPPGTRVIDLREDSGVEKNTAR